MTPNNPFDRLERLVLKRKVLIARKQQLEEVNLKDTGAHPPELRLEGSNNNSFTIADPKFLKDFYTNLHLNYVQKIQTLEKKITEHKHNNY